MRTSYRNSGYTSQRTECALNRRANLVIVVHNKKIVVCCKNYMEHKYTVRSKFEFFHS